MVVKSFSVISLVGMELENEKYESVNENENKENKPSLLHTTGFLFSARNKQVRRSVFQCSLCHIINPLLTKLVRSRWLDIGFVLILRFYGPRLRLGP